MTQVLIDLWFCMIPQRSSCHLREQGTPIRYCFCLEGTSSWDYLSVSLHILGTRCDHSFKTRMETPNVSRVWRRTQNVTIGSLGDVYLCPFGLKGDERGQLPVFFRQTVHCDSQFFRNVSGQRGNGTRIGKSPALPCS